MIFSRLLVLEQWQQIIFNHNIIEYLGVTHGYLCSIGMYQHWDNTPYRFAYTYSLQHANGQGIRTCHMMTLSKSNHTPGIQASGRLYVTVSPKKLSSKTCPKLCSNHISNCFTSTTRCCYCVGCINCNRWGFQVWLSTVFRQINTPAWLLILTSHISQTTKPIWIEFSALKLEVFSSPACKFHWNYTRLRVSFLPMHPAHLFGEIWSVPLAFVFTRPVLFSALQGACKTQVRQIQSYLVSSMFELS